MTPRCRRKAAGQDVGLIHSLQHAGLFRRTLVDAQTIHVDFQAPIMRLTWHRDRRLFLDLL